MKLDAGKRYAGFWLRLGATAIDTILFSLITGVLTLLINGVPDLSRDISFEQIDPWNQNNILEQLLMLAITVALWLRFLGTPGKLLLSCQVVDAETGGPITTKQALVRYLGYFVSMAPLFLGFLWIAWDKRKQGFHDKLAGTVVVVESGVEVDDESQKSLEQLMGEVR